MVNYYPWGAICGNVYFSSKFCVVLWILWHVPGCPVGWCSVLPWCCSSDFGPGWACPPPASPADCGDAARRRPAPQQTDAHPEEDLCTQWHSVNISFTELQVWVMCKWLNVSRNDTAAKEYDIYPNHCVFRFMSCFTDKKYLPSVSQVCLCAYEDTRNGRLKTHFQNSSLLK